MDEPCFRERGLRTGPQPRFHWWSDDGIHEEGSRTAHLQRRRYWPPLRDSASFGFTTMESSSSRAGAGMSVLRWRSTSPRPPGSHVTSAHSLSSAGMSGSDGAGFAKSSPDSVPVTSPTWVRPQIGRSSSWCRKRVEAILPSLPSRQALLDEFWLLSWGPQKTSSRRLESWASTCDTLLPCETGPGRVTGATPYSQRSHWTMPKRSSCHWCCSAGLRYPPP